MSEPWNMIFVGAYVKWLRVIMTIWSILFLAASFQAAGQEGTCLRTSHTQDGRLKVTAS